MKRILALTTLAAMLASAVAVAIPGLAAATTTCSFTTVGTTMKLNGNCTTDVTILIPDGFTLDGRGRTITAVDPTGGHFLGAVVLNGGSSANVKNLTVTVSGLANVCDGGADRLRGIMFDGASGSITKNTVIGINQGPSGCQEGNGIEVRNLPFDGTHPATKTVEVSHNTVANYQKTGIVANGDVQVDVNQNDVSSSATQAYLAANGIQLGFGAMGDVSHNSVGGNQWCGAEDTAATAILLYDAGSGVVVDHNDIGGNSDIGIYVGADNATVAHNKISDSTSIADCNVNGYDVGIGNYGNSSSTDGSSNSVTHNTASGFDTPFDGLNGGKNKVKGPKA